MDKVLRNKFGLSRKSKLGIGAVMVVMLLGSLFIYMELYGRIRDIAVSESERNVTNISQLNAAVVSRELENKQSLLESIAHNLSAGKIEDMNTLMQSLKGYSTNYGFYNMGILKRDARMWMTNGMWVDVNGQEEYMRALTGEPVVSKHFTTADGRKKEVNLLTAPVYYGDQLEYVLTATYESAELAKMMNLSALEGEGYIFLVDESGEAVIIPDKNGNDAYFEMLEAVKGATKVISEDIKTINFEKNGVSYYVHAESMEIEGWYLLTCAREKKVFASTQQIIQCVVMGILVLLGQIFLTLLVIMLLGQRFQKKIQRIVYKDKLLKEDNFEYLKAYYPLAIAETQGKLFLLILDVDHFKEYNYLYGNLVGDKLLKYIHGTFCDVLPEDRIFRYSADLFVALVKSEDVKGTEDKVCALLSRFAEDIEKNEIPSFEISIGIREVEGDEPFSDVYSDAMIAKNAVKGDVVKKYMVYDAGMREKRVEYMEMESGFKKALRNREFTVFYQPKFDMRTGKVIGAEALVRWIKANGTMISPGAFVPCFEESKQIIQLDEYMMENVCRQMRAMEEAGLEVKPVSVNLSRVHLKYPGIVEKIARILYDTGINPENLEFEITESALYEDNIPLKHIVSELHTMGCRVNIDDYGTGVSGPGSLANVEFDVLKLDKSFVDKIQDDKMGYVIRSTIELSSDLGMKIVAEGIEEKEQAMRLVEWGCYYAQGFYYSRPIPEYEYRKLLKQKNQ